MLIAAGISISSAATAHAAPTTPVISASQTYPQITNLTVDEKNDFVVEPGKIEVTGNPGDTVVRNISVTSRIREKTRFSVSTEDFQGSQTEDQPVVLLGERESPWSFKDKVVPAVSDFTLNFGDRIVLPVTVSIPQDAAPGGYFSAVIISNAPQVNEDAAVTNPTTRIISRIAVLFFIKVNGPTNPNGYTEDFRTSEPHFIYPSAPSGFKILFNNTGNQYLVPYGQIQVSNMWGSQVGSIPVNAYFSLPNALRYLTIAWNDNDFRFGRYTATLQLSRGYNGIIDTKTIAFWVLPWKILLPVLAAIVIVAFVIYFIVTRFEFRRKN